MDDATDTPTLLSPVVVELARHVAILDATLGQERQQHATALAQRDAERDAEVRGLRARLEAAEAETEMLRRDLDRMRSGHMTGSSGTVTSDLNGTVVVGMRA